MYDVNNHPRQESLNEEIGVLLGSYLKEVNRISDEYEVDPRDVMKQFNDSIELIKLKILYS